MVVPYDYVRVCVFNIREVYVRVCVADIREVYARERLQV